MTTTPRRNGKRRSNHYGSSSGEEEGYRARVRSMHPNEILAIFFAVGFFALALGINVFNVYQSLAVATIARFGAAGVFDFIFTLPGFNILAAMYRIGVIAVLVYSIILVRRSNTSSMIVVNPVWWVYLFILAYCAFVGLAGTFTTIPFIISAMMVACLKWVEVLFWTVQKRHPILWTATGLSYVIEAALQYEMMPIHADYSTLGGLLFGMGTPGFNGGGFLLLQLVVAVLGLLGVEIGARLYQVARNHAI